MKFSKVIAWRVPETVERVRYNSETLWKLGLANYVSLGDSIPAGHSINDDWAKDYGTKSQYGVNGNTETKIVPGCYTDLIRQALSQRLGGRVTADSFARSGDTVADLMEKLDHTRVRGAIRRADLVTVCIGANDILGPTERYIETYINTGDLSVLAETVEQNLAILADDTHPMSYTSMFQKLSSINPSATYVFTTIYNPYKYLWIDDGKDGFFSPLLNTIPQMTVLGFEVDEIIKQGLLDTSIIRTLYNRVNGLSSWSEKFVEKLNAVLKSKITAYGHRNFVLADTKAVYDPVPDRPISAPKHYNDLVNVEYTSGYNIMTMDWGRLWGNQGAYAFWWDLVTDYVSLSGVNLEGMAEDLIAQIIEKVIVQDVDPHPESYGHYAIEQAIEDALSWTTLPRRTITYQPNGGTGSMEQQTLIALDNYAAYTRLSSNIFGSPAEDYRWAGWIDAGGTTYGDRQLVGLTSDLTLTAQWSNLYEVVYQHTNHTNLYGSDETGHMECYALYIGGELKPKFGTFAEGSRTTYLVPYGTSIRVEVSNYNPNELTYDDVNCDVYWNDVSVSKGYRGTTYTFTLQQDLTIDFRWKIAGSLATFDAQSWEDCYITTR